MLQAILADSKRCGKRQHRRAKLKPNTDTGGMTLRALPRCAPQREPSGAALTGQIVDKFAVHSNFSCRTNNLATESPISAGQLLGFFRQAPNLLKVNHGEVWYIKIMATIILLHFS